MLRRKIDNELLKWKQNHNKTALLITGARQVGKTASIRQFGKNHYSNFIEINFITDTNANKIFNDSLRADDIILNLSTFVKKALIPGKTLIFLDEIQECPNARTAIKFLVEDGRFDYIESGSLLGVSYKEIPSLPVGYEEIQQMYPMDFEEFLWANNIQEDTINYLKECFMNERYISDIIHEEIKKLFQRYMIIGGMPAVVAKFVETKDIGQVINIQKRIMELYRQDITKYSDSEKMKIRQIFDHIPAELNKNNKRFTMSDINKNAKYHRYESGFMWLTDAGVSLPCYNIC
ncbi:MAG TPA: AAA family ATPase, partial [Clostridia bacterium]|nr:AAA family ATPase [Clostridia bacterium]